MAGKRFRRRCICNADVSEEGLGFATWNSLPLNCISSPFMLDNYAGEHFEHIRAVNAHAVEMDVLRNVNRNLSSQVYALQGRPGDIR